jgi:hypothetical protein
MDKETEKILPLVISIFGIALGALGFFLSISILAFIAIIVSVIGLVIAIKQKLIIAIILSILGIAVGAFSIYRLAENIIWLF